eukprot:Lankesteria_metandrocarpae@DN2956_c0_g1_i1.p1
MLDMVTISSAFHAFDKDGDGLITSQDFISVMRSVGIHLNADEIQAISNGPRTLNRKDCCDEAQKRVTNRDLGTEINRKLKEFDRQGKNQLDMSELRQVMKNLSTFVSENELDDFIASLDPKNTGQATLNDVVRYMTN